MRRLTKDGHYDRAEYFTCRRQGDRADFLKALAKLSSERRRDGAYGWDVTEDAADPGKMVEWFMVESLAEHLRQHRRVSKADADIQQETRRFHKGP